MRTRSHCPDDDADLAATLLAVRSAGGTYPPPCVPDDPESVVAWCNRYTPTLRLVLEVETTDGAAALGHVQLCDLTTTDDADLRDALVRRGMQHHAEGLELARLFVHPDLRGRGAGRMLLEAATSAAAEAGRALSLCVLETQAAATGLYQAEGWEKVAEFVGESGIVNRAYVPGAAIPAQRSRPEERTRTLQ